MALLVWGYFAGDGLVESLQVWRCERCALWYPGWGEALFGVVEDGDGVEFLADESYFVGSKYCDVCLCLSQGCAAVSKFHFFLLASRLCPVSVSAKWYDSTSLSSSMCAFGAGSYSTVAPLCLCSVALLCVLWTKDTWKEVAKGLWDKWNFPSCLSAIDGKHITIQAPSSSGSQYFNYKETFSTVLLALVDADYRIVLG